MKFNKAWVDVSFDFHKLFCVYTLPPLPTSNPSSVPVFKCKLKGEKKEEEKK